MKTFLLTIIGCVVLINEVSYAGPSSAAPAPPSSGNSANAAANSGGRNNQANASQPGSQNPNNQGGPGQTQAGNNNSANPAPGPINPPAQAGSSSAVATTKAALPGNKTTALKSLTARPPGVAQPVKPMFKDPRNRSPATAVIGGSPKPPAVISGATIHQKP